MKQCLGLHGVDCSVLSYGPRCEEHQRILDARITRAKRQQRPYTHEEQQRRAAAVAAHRATYGDWCPGWGRSAHVAYDLTADHPSAVATGGREDQPLWVLCRSCNSTKGAS